MAGATGRIVLMAVRQPAGSGNQVMTTVPLAWKNLTKDRRRLAAAVMGIAFAVVLMFQQRGFQHALFDSTVEIVRQMDADLIACHPNRFSLTVATRFDRNWLDFLASQPDVNSVSPLYIENMAARLRREQHRARPIRVIGFDPDHSPWLDPRGEITPRSAELLQPQVALMDRLSRAAYGFDLSPSARFPQSGELNGRQIHVVGSFHVGRDFANSGNMLMSKENFRNYFPHRGVEPLTVVDLGLIRLRDPADAAAAAVRLQQAAQDDLMVLTRSAFIDREIRLWNRSTPIGVIFNIGTAMGFIVGVIICYQVLANAIADHLSEFATLKAMGYSNYYFAGLIVRQAVYLGLLGFGPGLVFSWWLFQWNASWTALPLELTTGRIATVLAATLAMCILSGLLALRKLFAADPASLF